MLSDRTQDFVDPADFPSVFQRHGFAEPRHFLNGGFAKELVAFTGVHHFADFCRLARVLVEGTAAAGPSPTSTPHHPHHLVYAISSQ